MLQHRAKWKACCKRAASSYCKLYTLTLTSFYASLGSSQCPNRHNVKLGGLEIAVEPSVIPANRCSPATSGLLCLFTQKPQTLLAVDRQAVQLSNVCYEGRVRCPCLLGLSSVLLHINLSRTPSLESTLGTYCLKFMI